MITNKPDSCVPEWISGFVSTNQGLLQLPGHQVILRADLSQLNGKVAILSGGGAGHEPAHAGYVGRGMLTGAIIGPVFTSPPPKSVYAAIKAVNQFSPSGILLIVKNYTGDRLNFGLAKEWAEKDGIDIKMIIVGEDCAAVTQSKAGKRGLAGTVFIHKIAGAMAEMGKDLEFIYSKTQVVALNIGTIGICLKPCQLPGTENENWTMKKGEMCLGLGIHGEAGIGNMPFSSSKNLARTMVDHIITSDRGMKLESQEEVAVIINNLGGTSNLEMGIFAKDVYSIMAEKNITMMRSYVGTYMTSLQMQGVSVSVLRLSKIPFDVINYLDTETLVSNPLSSVREQPFNIDAHCLVIKDAKPSNVEQKSNRNICSQQEAKLVLKCVQASCNALINNFELLNSFDKEAGDGDCGSTNKRGAEAILKLEESNFCDSAHLFGLMSLICSEQMGGTSGAIYSILFTTMASNLAPTWSLKSFGRTLRTAVNTVKHYGQASRGDRTLIDVLEPVSDALLTCGDNALENLRPVRQIAKENAARTNTMVARVGRASYVDTSVIKHPDPGAYAAALVIEACVDVLLDN